MHRHSEIGGSNNQAGMIASGSGNKKSNSNLFRNGNGNSTPSQSSNPKQQTTLERKTRSASRGLIDSPGFPNLKNSARAEEELEQERDTFIGFGNGLGRPAGIRMNPHPRDQSSTSFSNQTPGTSVNVATAFKNSQVKDQSNGTPASYKLPVGEVRRKRELEKGQSDVEIESADEESGKETQMVITASGKKRKKPPAKEESEVDEVLLEGAARGTAKKAIMQPESNSRRGHSRAGSVRAGSVPAKMDSTYQPEPSASSSSDSGPARRKGKARSSDKGAGAIEIGHGVGTTWYGKKKKGKGRSSNESNGMEEDQDNSRIEEDGDESLFQNMPAPTPAPRDLPPPVVEGNSNSIVGATYYLAPGAPLNDTPRPPGALPRPQTIPSLPESQPRRKQQKEFSFDDSILERSQSFDESGVRGESYQYEAENEMVIVLENKHNAGGEKRIEGNGKGVQILGHANALAKRIGPPPARDPLMTPNVNRREIPEFIEEMEERVVERSWGWKKMTGFAAIGLALSFLAHSGIKYYNSPAITLPSYQAPIIPAESFEAIVSRLTDVESSLEQIFSISSSDRAQAEKESAHLFKLSETLLDLQSGIEQAKKRIDLVSDENESSHAKDLNLIQKLEQELTKVQTEVLELDGKVERVSKSVKAMEENEKLMKILLEGIEKRLPNKVAIKFDSKGRVELDPTFWRYLQTIFVEKSDLKNLDSKVISGNGKGARDWDSFLEKNSIALENLINSNIENRLQSDGIISKKSFLDILKREIKKLKVEFEAATNENLESIGRELLSKVAKQDELRLKDRLQPAPAAAPSTITFSTPDGTNLSALINSVVDSAILKYSKDVLAKPDYAAFSSGARVIPSLTSQTYSIRPKGFKNQFLGLITGNSIATGNSPATALSENIQLGSCWPFAGAKGQIGILLSRKIKVEEIIFQHSALELALGGEIGSAPQEFEAWGVVEDFQDLEKMKIYREKRNLLEKEERDEEQDASLPASSNHLLLATGIYNPYLKLLENIQTFSITEMAKELEISFSVVIIKILSNWGDENYTCVYRIRVGGQVV